MKIQKNEKTANPRPVKKLYEACCVILISSFGMALLISVLLSAPLGLIIGYTSDLSAGCQYDNLDLLPTGVYLDFLSEFVFQKCGNKAS